MTAVNFTDWLQERLNERGWSQSDLARKVNMTTGAINHIIHGNRNPGNDFLINLAKAMKLPPEDVFRAAGIFPQNTDEPPGLGEWIQRYLDASEEERQEMLEYARFKTRNKSDANTGLRRMGS